MRRIIISFVVILLMAATHRLAAQDEKKTPAADEEPAAEFHYRWSMGIVTGPPIVGVHGEFMFIPELGVRVIGLYIFGANFVSMNKSEYILSVNTCLSYHFMGGKSFFDPVLMVGSVYSYHHWATKLNLYYNNHDRNFTIREGTIQDMTFGFGAGLNFICAKYFRIGLNLWFNYDYRVYISSRMKKLKGFRFILPVPIVEFTFLF